MSCFQVRSDKGSHSSKIEKIIRAQSLQWDFFLMVWLKSQYAEMDVVIGHFGIILIS